MKAASTIAVLGLVASCLLAISMPLLTQEAGGPWARWAAKDGATATLVTNHRGGSNYRVRNGGPGPVTVQVRDANDAVIAAVEVQANTTTDAGVPDGGDLQVDNPADDPPNAATGGYKSI